MGETFPDPRIGMDARTRAFCMPDGIARLNIEHFKKLLETEGDPQKRTVIERLLAEEELKLATLLNARDDRKKR